MGGRIMKRLFSTSALVGLGLCFAQNALAANLPMPAMAPPAPPPLSWTGFYLGANASIPWTDPVTFTGADPQGTFGGAPLFPPLIPPLTTSASDIGMALGPIVGYNLQMGSFLLGVESDIDWGILSLSADQTPVLPGVACGGGPTFFPGCSSFLSKVEVGTLASVRGRAGWIWNNPKSDWTFNLPGSFLFYGTGGVGWAHESYQANISCPNGAVGFVGPNGPVPPVLSCSNNTLLAPINVNRTETGPVFGGGVDWLTLSSRGKIILGFEYLHYEFKGISATGLTTTAGGVPVPSATCPAGTACVHYTASKLDINDVRFRITYKWD